MQRFLAVAITLWLSSSALAADHYFDLARSGEGAVPEGFRAFRVGSGKIGEWKIVLDELPTAFKPFNTHAVVENRYPVIGQLARDPEDERFPVLVYDGETYGDLTLKVRLKVVAGASEQIAGVVFRAQDDKNFYVARINTIDGNVRFYKFVNGIRSTPIGNDRPLKKGEWYELSVVCIGNKIRIQIDDHEAIPELTDNSFTKGRIGFITKSDTVAYFADVRVSYRPIEMLASVLVRQVSESQPRLRNFRIYARTSSKPDLHVLAAKNEKDVGMVAAETEQKVFDENRMYYGEDDGQGIVTAPLHDRNGEIIGVAKFFLKSFPGQTKANAIGRVMPTLQNLERQVGSADDLSAE